MDHQSARELEHTLFAVNSRLISWRFLISIKWAHIFSEWSYITVGHQGKAKSSILTEALCFILCPFRQCRRSSRAVFTALLGFAVLILSQRARKASNIDAVVKRTRWTRNCKGERINRKTSGTLTTVLIIKTTEKQFHFREQGMDLNLPWWG